MARPPSEKVGRGPCPSCGEPVTFRRSSGGMLTHKCDSCDSSGYCESGGTAHAKRMASLKQITEAIAAKLEPESVTEIKPVPAAKRPPNSVFSLADL